MKGIRFCELVLKSWFVDKQPDSFLSAHVNGAYRFEVKKESEKAVQIRIFKQDKFSDTYDSSNWFVWIPKSVIDNLEVLA